jgi:hypothetical protein
MRIEIASRSIELLEEADQVARGGQLTRPQEISPRCGSRYNNGLQSYFLDQSRNVGMSIREGLQLRITPQ